MRTRISHQLIVAVALTAAVIFGLLSHLLITSHQRSMITIMEGYADESAETIQRSTRFAMLQNQPDEVRQIIDAIGRQENILGIRILNKDGRVIYSPDGQAIGTMVDKQAEACYVCHATDAPLERPDRPSRTRFFDDSQGRARLGIIKPIYNEPSCSQAACHAHPSDQAVLGVLDITLDLTGTERRMADERTKALLTIGVAILSISFLIWLIVDQLVGKPVGKLMKATDAVAAGNLDYRIQVERNDELGKLQLSFNEMTSKITETETQLYQSNKMASVGQLAAGIAHEINNPLTGILTFSSLLLNQPDQDPAVHEDLETIVRETIRCRDIVKGLLDFSRQVPPRKTNSDFNAIVNQALAIVDHELDVANIRVTRGLLEELPTVRVDANQMIQILINLLFNATHAIGTKEGGEIFVGTDLTTIDSSAYIEVKVADNGCGIPNKNLQKIFDPFFTTRDTRGTGLGLAVVWGIVNEHGGTISVDSKPDRGTTFTIHLPVTEPNRSSSEINDERTTD
jgi:two-component system NtrC family sensor kinase